MARRSDRRSTDDEWLPLGEASRFLGVNADSLRRWADEGRVEVFTTPGGHRRFARRSLDRLVRAGRRDARLPLARLGATPSRVSAAYRRSYLRGAPSLSSAGSAVAEPDREAFRQEGRRLVAALIAYLDATDRAGRAAAEEDAILVVSAYGRRLTETGVDLGDAIGLFVAGRRPFLAELGAAAGRRRLEPEQLAGLYEDASGLLDRLLLRFVAAHRSSSGPPPVPMR